MKYTVPLFTAILLLAVTAGGADAAPESDAPRPADPLWTRQCVKNPQGNDVCYLQQFVVAMPEKTALLKAVFSYLGPKGGPRLELTAPLGTLLPPGLTLTIDGRPPLILPMAFCQAGGCDAVVDLDEKALDQFRKGKTATVRYVTQEHKALDLPLALDGLAAALPTIAP